MGHHRCCPYSAGRHLGSHDPVEIVRTFPVNAAVGFSCGRQWGPRLVTPSATELLSEARSESPGWPRVLAELSKHRAAFVPGILAALVLSAAKLAMPWPFRSLLSPLLQGEPGLDSSLSTDALQACLALLACVVVMGLSDAAMRLRFAQAAARVSRLFRDAALLRLEQHDPGERAIQIQPVSARAKSLRSALRSFGVHVIVSGIHYVGLVAALVVVWWPIGLVFLTAGVVQGFLTVRASMRVDLATLRAQRRSYKQTRRWALGPVVEAPRRLWPKLTATRSIVEAMAWAYLLFGVAAVVSAALVLQAIAHGQLRHEDALVVIAYVLGLRQCTVQLVRQGARTGKIRASVAALLPERLLPESTSVLQEPQ